MRSFPTLPEAEAGRVGHKLHNLKLRGRRSELPFRCSNTRGVPTAHEHPRHRISQDSGSRKQQRCLIDHYGGNEFGGLPNFRQWDDSLGPAAVFRSLERPVE